jgi:hypothetical protein
MKSGGVKLVLWAQTCPLSEVVQFDLLMEYMFTVYTSIKTYM